MLLMNHLVLGDLCPVSSTGSHSTLLTKQDLSVYRTLVYFSWDTLVHFSWDTLVHHSSVSLVSANHDRGAPANTGMRRHWLKWIGVKSNPNVIKTIKNSVHSLGNRACSGNPDAGWCVIALYDISALTFL